MEKVNIRKLKPSHSDEEGWVYNCFSGEKSEEIAVFHRKKGIVYGQHYHTGADPAKDPEKFLLLQGSIKLYAKDVKTGEEEEYFIDSVSEIKIEPFVYHEFTALEDVTFVEYRVTPFDKKTNDNVE